MDPSHIGIIVAIFVLVILTAFFSAAETSFSSANKVRLRTMQADGNVKAGKILTMLDNYDKVISTILVGNNIINIVIASLATVLFTSLISNGSLAVTLSSVIVTIVILIFGEISPKLIAKERPEKLVIRLYPILQFFIIVLLPINAIFVMWKKLLAKVFKLNSKEMITEDELITYVETAANEGGIDEHESRLIRSAIEFEDLDAKDIMVPRVNVIAVPESVSIEQVSELFKEHGFSRIPVFSGTIDSIVGIIHEKDFYTRCLLANQPLKEIIQSSICVSKNMKISAVLRLLQKAKLHMAVVVDEFGGTSGIVTLEDILEELVGEIWDEHDEEEILLKRVDDDTFIVSGSENLEDMFESLNIKTKAEFESTTVGGWMTEQLEKIPLSGESFTFENVMFTVAKANTKRVLEIKVKLLPRVDNEE